MENNLVQVLQSFYRQHNHWSTVQKGDFFEKCVTYFFKQDKTQVKNYQKVQSWSDFVFQYNKAQQPTKKLNRQDLGIDLVLTTHSGQYFAVQCKYYADEQTVTSYREISSFLVFLGGKNIFVGGILVTTGNVLSDNLSRVVADTDRYQFIFLGGFQLSQASFVWADCIFNAAIHQRRIPPLFAHQQAAVTKVTMGFKTHDRGQLIMACGTGKTRTALAIIEEMIKTRFGAPKHFRVLVSVPSISLVSQILNEFSANAQIVFDSIVVCSDRGAGERYGNKSELKNVWQLIPVPVAQSSAAIRRQLTQLASKVTIVFTTYQSLPKIKQAQFTPPPKLPIQTTSIRQNRYLNLI